MSDQQPTTPPGLDRFVSGLLFLLGIILLLPGLCSLVSAILIFTLPDDQVIRGLRHDPTIPALWLVCLLISAGGVALIASANRRNRRN
jgi:hypothetical protein